MSRNKRKAFTLTELLVVVVVIGVLAAVVLPKYTKVIETRKTTEAENMMAAVRTEQERRCALDKTYVNSEKKNLLVNVNVIPGYSTKAFDYQLLDNGGMEATSKGKYSYTLRMPSYADGRICCRGTGCSKLNKDYPSCDDLPVAEDFRMVPSSCLDTEGVDPVFKECGDAVVKQACSAGTCGFKTRSAVCNHTTGEYDYSAWDESACIAQPETLSDQPCSKGCGKTTISYTCNPSTGQWDKQEGTCDRSGCPSACLSAIQKGESLEISLNLGKAPCAWGKNQNGTIINGNMNQPGGAEKRTLTCQTHIKVDSQQLAQVREQAVVKAKEKGYESVPDDCYPGGFCNCTIGTNYFTSFDTYLGPRAIATGWPDKRSFNNLSATLHPQISYMQCVAVDAETGECPDVGSPGDNTSYYEGEEDPSEEKYKQTTTWSWENTGNTIITHSIGIGTAVTTGYCGYADWKNNFAESCAYATIDWSRFNSWVGACRENGKGQQVFVPTYMEWDYGELCPNAANNNGCFAQGTVWECTESVTKTNL